MIRLDHPTAGLADAIDDERIDVDEVGRRVDHARSRNTVARDDQRHADGLLVQR